MPMSSANMRLICHSLRCICTFSTSCCYSSSTWLMVLSITCRSFSSPLLLST